VNALLYMALREERAGDLAGAVDVVGVNACGILDAPARLQGPGLGSEDAGFKLVSFLMETPIFSATSMMCRK